MRPNNLLLLFLLFTPQLCILLRIYSIIKVKLNMKWHICPYKLSIDQVGWYSNLNHYAIVH